MRETSSFGQDFSVSKEQTLGKKDWVPNKGSQCVFGGSSRIFGVGDGLRQPLLSTPKSLWKISVGQMLILLRLHIHLTRLVWTKGMEELTLSCSTTACTLYIVLIAKKKKLLQTWGFMVNLPQKPSRLYRGRKRIKVADRERKDPPGNQVCAGVLCYLPSWGLWGFLFCSPAAAAHQGHPCSFWGLLDIHCLCLCLPFTPP